MHINLLGIFPTSVMGAVVVGDNVRPASTPAHVISALLAPAGEITDVDWVAGVGEVLDPSKPCNRSILLLVKAPAVAESTEEVMEEAGAAGFGVISSSREAFEEPPMREEGILITMDVHVSSSTTMIHHSTKLEIL